MSIPVLPTGDGQYLIPPTPAGELRFSYTPTQPLDLLRAAQKCSPLRTPEFARAAYVRPLGAPFTPAMPLSVGHLTMLISGQETGVLKLHTDEGQEFLVKGMSKKVVEQRSEDNYDDKCEYIDTRVNEKERLVTVLTQAYADGRLEFTQEPQAVGDFITRYAEQIADAILEKNRPLYDYHPTPAEWVTTATTALGLPPLPGRAERGLFEVQRHFAIAAARVMKKHGAAIMNCEMGFGKTSSSIGALEVLDEWPVIILCPGHMVFKWQRDLERASNPDDPIQARVITYPVRAEAWRWSDLQTAIETAGGQVLETRRWQVEPQTLNDPGGRRLVRIACAPERIEGVARLFNGLGLRDKNEDGQSITLKTTIQLTGDGLQVEFVDRDEYTLFDFAADFQSGRLGRKAAAVVAFDPAKFDAGDNPNAKLPTRWVREWNEYARAWQNVKVPYCPTCGATVKGKPRFCKNEIVELVLGADGKKMLDKNGQPTQRTRICGAPLFEMSRWRRTGVARLVQRKFRHFFKVYVSDESHKAQNGRSDIGTADQRLISATKYSLALTGTLFGGTAGSLFYLLYHRSPALRRLYEFRDWTRWVDHYGLWEREWNQREPLAGERGASTGIERWKYRQDELPGVAPAVIRYLLPITLFGNGRSLPASTDLGYSLPPMHELVEPLAMTTTQQEQLEAAGETILRKAMEMARDGDPGGIATWFNTMRYRPASAFRDETAFYEGNRGESKGKVINVSLPAVIQPGNPDLRWLPKERGLAEIVKQNMTTGRKTLVFVEQSGTRDIRSRLKLAMETLAPGGDLLLAEAPRFVLAPTPQIGILSADDMSPARREAWIRMTSPKLDSLIVNPRLVETGLDLIMFSDLVFYETTVSLYTLWQAMRRVWRLGQTAPEYRHEVFVTFLAYLDTVEMAILSRMGQKKKAAQLLYGKEASGVLVEVEDDDIQRQIIQDALSGKTFKDAGEAVKNLQGIFTTGDEKPVLVSQSPMGILVASSPNLVLTELKSGETYQLSLFGEAVPARAQGQATVIKTEGAKSALFTTRCWDGCFLMIANSVNLNKTINFISKPL